jgi:hypothetical protein
VALMRTRPYFYFDAAGESFAKVRGATVRSWLKVAKGEERLARIRCLLAVRESKLVVCALTGGGTAVGIRRNWAAVQAKYRAEALNRLWSGRGLLHPSCGSQVRHDCDLQL